MGSVRLNKINMSTIPNPPVNSVVVGIDLDGATKQKDSAGNIIYLSEPLSRSSLTLDIIDMTLLANPAIGTMLIAIDLDGTLKTKNSSGTITPIGGGGGSSLPIAKYVYLIDDASDVTLMGGASNNVYALAQDAYDAAVVLTAGNTIPIIILVGKTLAANVGGITLVADWNSYVSVQGLNSYDSNIDFINGDNASGNAYSINGIFFNNIAIATVSLIAAGATGDGGLFFPYGDGFAIATILLDVADPSNTFGVTGSLQYSAQTTNDRGVFLGDISMTGPGGNSDIYIDSENAVASTLNLDVADSAGNVVMKGIKFLNAVVINQSAGGIGFYLDLDGVTCSSITFNLRDPGSITANVIRNCYFVNPAFSNSNASAIITINAYDNYFGVADFTNTASATYFRLIANNCTFETLLNLSANSRLYGCNIKNTITNIGSNCLLTNSNINCGPTSGGGSAITNATAVTVITNGSYFRIPPATTISITNVNNTPITKAALATLISTNRLVIGTQYIITDAQDALNGTVSMTATSYNTLDGNGVWSFAGKLPAQGRFRLQTGTAGSVDQITVVMPTGIKNLMTASVPYTTSRNNTAILVVANINANTATSGCRAFVTTSTTSAGNFDVPIIHIEAIETSTAFVHTMVVTVTTLTISNQSNPAQGFTTNNLSLKCSYDLTNDRILYAVDVTRNCSVAVTTARIAVLTYNPITTFRWGDPRFTSFNLTESGYRDTAFRNTTAFTWRLITWNNTSCSQFMFSNNAVANVSLQATSTLLNLNSVSGLNLIASTCSLNIQNVDVGSFAITSQTAGSITITNSTFGSATTQTTLNLGLGDVSIAITTVSCSSTLNSSIQRSFGSLFSITLSTCNFTRFNLIRTRLLSTFLINNCTGITTVDIQGNNIIGPVDINGCTFSSTLTIQRNNIGETGSPTNIGLRFINCTMSGFLIQDCYTVSFDFSAANFSLDCTTSTVTTANLFPTFTGGVSVQFQYATVDGNDFTGVSGNFSIGVSTVFANGIMPSSPSGILFGEFTVLDSKIAHCVIVPAEALMPILANGDVGVNITSSNWFNNTNMQLTAAGIMTFGATNISYTTNFIYGVAPNGFSYINSMNNCDIHGGELLAIGIDAVQFINYKAVNYSNLHLWDPVNLTPDFSQIIILQNVTLDSSYVQFQQDNNLLDLRIYNISFVQQKLIVIDNVNDIWINEPTAVPALAQMKITLINNQFRFTTNLLDFSGASGSFVLGYVFKGLVFKKSTYSSNQVVSGGTVNVGFTGNPGAFFNLSAATINATPAGETGTLVRVTTGTPMLFAATASSGLIQIDIEGVLQSLEL